MVKKGWESGVSGTAQFRLVHKLKSIKGLVKDWNKGRHVIPLKELEAKLEDMQHRVQFDPFDLVLAKEEVVLQAVAKLASKIREG